MSEDYKKPFIPLWMDQAGFTPHQYRVHSHLWSRGQGTCFPSLETIAACCKMNIKTVKSAIKDLEVLGYVQRKKRKAPGVRFSNEYILTGPNETPLTSPNQAPVKSQPAQMEPRLTSPNETPANRPKWSPGNDTSLNDTSLNETTLFPGEVLPMAEKPSSKKNHLQELAEEIYQAYPKKAAKPEALKAIAKALKENDPAFLLERTRAYAEAIVWKEKQFIPYPATWFNRGQFNDDPENWKSPSPPKKADGRLPQMSIEAAAKLCGGRVADYDQDQSRRRGYEENL